MQAWFKELPQPLLSIDSPNNDGGDTTVGEILSALPEPNKSVMEWLLDLCVRVYQSADRNKMGPEALAAVFSPNLMALSKNPTIQKAQERLVAHFFARAVEYRKKKTSSYLHMRTL